MKTIKPFDFVKTQAGHIAMVLRVRTVVDKQEVDIQYIDRRVDGQNCWIPAEELQIINSLTYLLGMALASSPEYPVSCVANVIEAFRNEA